MPVMTAPLDAASLKRPPETARRAQLAFATVIDLQGSSSVQRCPAHAAGIVKWCHSARRLAQALNSARCSFCEVAYAEVVVFTDNVDFVQRECKGSPHRGPLRVLPFDEQFKRMSVAWVNATIPARVPRNAPTIPGLRYASTGRVNGISYLRKLEPLAHDEYGAILLTDNDVDLVPAYDWQGSDAVGEANRSYYLGTFERHLQEWPKVVRRFLYGTHVQLIATLDGDTPINAGLLLLKPSRRVFDMACRVLSSRQFNTTHGFEGAGPPSALLDPVARRRFRLTRMMNLDTWDFTGGNVDQGMLTYLYTMRMRKAYDLSLHCPFTGSALCGSRPVPGSRSGVVCPISVRHLWGGAKPWQLRYTCPAYFHFLDDERSFDTPCGAYLRRSRASAESGIDLPKGSSRSCGGVPVCVE